MKCRVGITYGGLKTTSWLTLMLLGDSHETGLFRMMRV